jgi:hypothetical protein
LDITSRINCITSFRGVFHNGEDLGDLVFSPAALGPFADREGRGIDDAILEPAQKSPFAHREQAGNGGIGESIASGEISRHRSLGDSTTYTGDLATILVTKMFSRCGLDSSLRWWVLATAGVMAVIVGISPNPQWALDPQL